MPATCTIVTTATGGTCGAPAVHTFTGTDGTTIYAECAEHTTAHIAVTPVGEYKVGDHVMVHRYGKEYPAKVTRIGARGAAYATFTYAKGTTRTVRI